MRLRELNAKFLRHEFKREVKTFRAEDGSDYQKEVDAEYYITVDTLAEADGVEFLCPVCFHKNCGRVGTHGVICWFVGKVPDSVAPGPGRWTPEGTGLDDLTFVPGNPAKAISVFLTGEGCKWHGYVRNGEATLS